jgi:uridine kinase
VTGDLDAVVAHLLETLPRDRRALVAVDGVGGSGKSTVANRLVELVEAHPQQRPTVVLHADDFFRPAAARHARGRFSPEGFWLDAYDYDALVSWALVPLRRGQPHRTHVFDRASAAAVRPDPVAAPADALVLVEGTFLHREELVDHWDASVWLEVPFDVAAGRMHARDGVDPDPDHGPMRRYLGAQRLYLAAATPRERAALVLDVTDLARPMLITSPGGR